MFIYCKVNNKEESDHLLAVLEEAGVKWHIGTDIKLVKKSMIEENYDYFLALGLCDPGRLTWIIKQDLRTTSYGQKLSQDEFLFRATGEKPNSETNDHEGMIYNPYTGKWSWF